jgi:D-amino-acid dehydrogenase
MRIAVIGAGIIGITTAYELALDGHEVTVFERRGAAAEETSFANAGLVAPGYVTPWAAPGMPGKVLSHLFSRHAPVKLALPLSGSELAWMWKWFRACKLETYLANRARMQRLAFYSRERLHHLTAELQLEYDGSPGYMVLLRSEQDSKLVQPGLAGAARGRRGLQGNRPRGGSQDRAGAEPGHPFPGRGAPAQRRGGQLPAVCAAAEERSPAHRREL